MPLLLNTSAVAMCGHGGRAVFTTPAPRVRIGGANAVSAVGAIVITGCANPPPPAGSGPGVTATVTSGQTVRVRSMGVPLLTQAMSAMAVPCSAPVTVVSAGNARVNGM